MSVPKTVTLIASGDLRASANQKCEPAQAAMEAQIAAAFDKEGVTVQRGHPYDPAKGHGFIDSQKYGMEVFRGIDPDAPLVVAEAVWQYSHHILPGLSTHRGPILTLANWSGTWPGLVGMLNLNGSLTKAGVSIFDFVERGVHRPVLSQRPAPVAQDGQGDSRHAPRPPLRPKRHRDPARRRRAGRAVRPRLEAGQGDHGRLRRGLHGHVQRHPARRPAPPDRRVQGAPEPVRAVRQDGDGLGRRGAGGLRVAEGQGDDVPVRPRRRRST